MARTLSSRLTHTLSLVAALTLPAGCIIEGGAPRNNLVDPPVVQYAGCPALQGVGNSGLIGLNSDRGQYVSLEAFSALGFYVQHYQGRGIVGAVSRGRNGGDATFRIVNGLADSRCISFESANYPGYFLNHQEGPVFLDPAENNLAYAEDATFCPRPGLADAYALSFESCGHPGMYINNLGGDLFVSDEPGYEFEDDATFYIDAPF